MNKGENKFSSDNMRNCVLYVLLIVTACSFSSCLSIISKTPRKINPKPLFSLQLDKSINLISTLMSDSTLKTKYRCNFRRDFDFIHINSTNDTTKGIFRGIEIYQFNTNFDAVKKYLDYKKTFSNHISARIYKQKTSGSNRYFMIYNTIRFDYNHGLPYAINNDPELMLGFVVDKYFISISYEKFSLGKKTQEYYVIDMNNDILYISQFLNDMVKINNIGK